MGEVRALKRSYVITRSQRAIRVEAIATFAVSRIVADNVPQRSDLSCA